MVIDVGQGNQLVKVSDEIPSWASIDTPLKVWLSNGTNRTVNPESYINLGNGSFVCFLIYFITTDNAEFDGVVFPEKGVYFAEIANSGYVTGIASANSETPEITWDGNIGTLKTIDSKYIPSELNEIILPSSTSGSSKKFKITVNDNGAITATEVTS